MSARHIVVCIGGGASGHEPDAGLEGLRAAVGLVRANECHTVDVVLTRESLSWLQIDEVSEARAMVKQLHASDVCWYVSRSALDEGAEPHADLSVVDEDTLQALLSEADVVLRY